MTLHKEPAAEHRRLLRLRAPFALTEARIMAGHLEALGIDTTGLHTLIDGAADVLMMLAAKALEGVEADTPEQANGMERT